MPDARDRLRSLLDTHALMTGATFEREHRTLQAQRDSGAFEIDRVVPGRLVEEANAGFYLVRRDFPLETLQGDIPLGAALEANSNHLALCARDDELEAFDPRTAVFVDTETTGLAGGAGTVCFLIGAGYFTGDTFRLEQCFMRDFDDEEPMLGYLAGLFADKEAIVSYNGKCFDLPLLRTRFIQNRIPFRLDAALHFDLVYSARRIWKRRLSDCSLNNIERNVLGIRREGDVPSYLIPQIWLDYLRTRDARKLDAVFYHHQMDILSLAALTARLSEMLSQVHDARSTSPVEDRLEIARLHYKQRRYADAVRLAQSLLDRIHDDESALECLGLAARASKRLEDWPLMEQLWTQLLAVEPRSLDAREELAKYYEHRARNLAKAEDICVETLQFLETRQVFTEGASGDTGARAAFEYRLERIRRKLRRRA